MSNKSNDNGRAYEYIFIQTLEQEIKKTRLVEIKKDSSYSSSEKSWNNISSDLQAILIKSSSSAIQKIFELEPLILENNSNVLILSIQDDSKGKEGDVRDILITREDIQWEIGLSVKHNHFAVKHSRLSKSLDFGDKWFGMKCSDEYWKDIKPIFEYLDNEKKKCTNWRDLPAKENDVYIPLLKAFMNEVKYCNQVNPTIPCKMVEYLLGKFDFYKVISIDNKQITQIHSYNLRGKLNQPSKIQSSKIQVPIVNLPTRIVHLEFKPDSNNTIELYLDEGWQFNFRIHNASTKVESSLKFDIQLIGMPVTILSIDCTWK